MGGYEEEKSRVREGEGVYGMEVTKGRRIRVDSRLAGQPSRHVDEQAGASTDRQEIGRQPAKQPSRETGSQPNTQTVRHCTVL
jgi:hypothetical protein